MNDLPSSEFAVEQPTMEAAIRRLISALNGLEAVVERRQENDRNQDNLAARIQALGIDRSRLADELDEAQARSQTLEEANRTIAARLDGAIATIRSVLEPEEEQP